MWFCKLKIAPRVRISAKQRVEQLHNAANNALRIHGRRATKGCKRKLITPWATVALLVMVDQNYRTNYITTYDSFRPTTLHRLKQLLRETLRKSKRKSCCSPGVTKAIVLAAEKTHS
jgi:hypothetical protein